MNLSDLKNDEMEFIQEGASVLLLLVEGYQPADIADMLDLDAGTVDDWDAFWQSSGKVSAALAGDPTSWIVRKVTALEARLRPYLPADLHADFWIKPTPRTLKRSVDHLFTLRGHGQRGYYGVILSGNQPTEKSVERHVGVYDGNADFRSDAVHRNSALETRHL